MIWKEKMKMSESKLNIPWTLLAEDQKIKASPSADSDIWWMHLKNKYALMVNFSGTVKMDLSQICFSGADIQLIEKNKKSVLVLSLNKNADIEIFNRFGQDLISVPVYGDKQKYADALLVRIKQWMEFLKKSKKKEIDLRIQLGLIAELMFLEYLHSEHHFSYKELLAAWQGPEKASKDFMFSDFFAEVKACFDDENTVRISNEQQLMQESKRLFLVCYKFTQDAFADNLKEIIVRLKEQIKTENENLITMFEQKLLSAGYNPAILYENLISVEEKSIAYYEVGDDFPCITASMLPGCISNVKYDLNLTGISKYMVQSIIKG